MEGGMVTMTIDEAIRHAEEVADELDLRSDLDTDCERYLMSDDEKKTCRKCAEEHRQLAEWLKELKALRAHIDLTIRAETLKQDIPDTNVGDMVSRQAAIKQAKELFTLGGCYCDQPAIIGMLNALPSAEPEIIWCKDCKYKQYDEVFKVMYCDGKQILPMHYCGWAERRTDVKPDKGASR